MEPIMFDLEWRKKGGSVNFVSGIEETYYDLTDLDEGFAYEFRVKVSDEEDWSEWYEFLTAGSSDLVRLRNVRFAITMDGTAFSVSVNANTRPTFATGTKGGPGVFSDVVKLENESLILPEGEADFFPGGGRWFVDTNAELDVDFAEGSLDKIFYSEIVRWRSEPLEVLPGWTGDAFTLGTPINLSMQFATGQFGQFASEPFDLNVHVVTGDYSIVLTDAEGNVLVDGDGNVLTGVVEFVFDEGLWEAATYTQGDFTADQNAPETGTVLVLLLTLSHPSWAEPVRLSTDPTNRITETTTDVIYGTLSRGEHYYFLPLQITLPSQTEEGPLRMRVVLDNVSRDLVAELRSLSSPPSVDVDLVSTTNANEVLASWPQFLLVNVDYSAETISGELVLETLFHEPFPAGTFTPSEFVGLF